MGANVARHTLEVLDTVCPVPAIELLTVAQAIDLQPDGLARLGQGTSRGTPKSADMLLTWCMTARPRPISRR